jgi:AmiR/NasT family two-component response regulator
VRRRLPEDRVVAEPEAFARLRAYARNHNLRLTDVAQAAIDGTLDP